MCTSYLKVGREQVFPISWPQSNSNKETKGFIAAKENLQNKNNKIFYLE